MLMGIISLCGSPFLISWLNSPPSNINYSPPTGYESDTPRLIDNSGNSKLLNVPLGAIGFICLGLPLAAIFWWAALEVADDRHWENSLEEVWENRHAHSIAGTLQFANQLRARGMQVDSSMLITEDIYTQAHQLIESTDENTLRLYMAAILAASNKKTQYHYRKNINRQSLPQRPALKSPQTKIEPEKNNQKT